MAKISNFAVLFHSIYAKRIFMVFRGDARKESSAYSPKMMKRIIVIVCLIMATITNVMAQQTDVPVILTAGQSNADGRVPVAELPGDVH